MGSVVSQINTLIMNPDGPYLIQSGRFQGHYLEELMLSNPEYVFVLNSYRQAGKPENALQRHLRLLLESMPQTKVLCPICQTKSIKYFLFLNHETIMPELCCCESAACREHLRLNHPNDYLMPIKFSSMMVFKTKTLRAKSLSLIKRATGLKGRPDAEQIFKTFVGEPLKKA